MAEAHYSDLSQSFEHAASVVRSLSSNLDTKVLLKLYAHYKQATVGPCQTSSSFTSWFGPNRMKQDAWRSLGTMTKEEAMQSYICLAASAIKDTKKEGEIIDKENLDDEEESDEFDESENEAEEKGKIGWVRVSRPAVLQEFTSISDEDKSLIDWAREGTLEGLSDALKNASLDLINQVDLSGMTPLHWAADRGHVEAVQLLINAGASTKSKDSEGQTALHYAASCGHGKVVNILLEAGSDPEAIDNDGERPVDLASVKEIKDLFAKLR